MAHKKAGGSTNNGRDSVSNVWESNCLAGNKLRLEIL